jgi:hypothetical protein
LLPYSFRRRQVAKMRFKKTLQPIDIKRKSGEP